MRATIEQLKARVSERRAEEAVDDGDNAQADLQQVLDEGYRKARAMLAGHAAPQDTVVDAELTFAAWLLYVRRGFAGEQNPFEEDKKAVTDTLRAIARGEIDTVEAGDDSQDIAAEPGSLGSGGGLMA
jgi:hypothetical protein